MAPRIIDLYRHLTTERKLVLTPESTNVLRLHRARPVVKLEVPASWAFRPGGSVFAPRPGPDDPLVVLAVALLHAASRPDEALLVAGHAPDEARSRSRARSVLLLLRGEREAWAAESAGAADLSDVQAALAWAARARGLACDAGPIDGLDGPRTRAGIAGLRAASGPGAGSGAFGVEDWGALFDLLRRELGALLDGEPGGQGLRLVGEGAVGCAATWAPDRVRMEGHATSDAERVDLLLFRPSDLPALDCHAGAACDWRRCDLYRKGRYRVERPDLERAPPPAAEVALRVLDARGLAVDGVAVRFTLPDASADVATDAQGWARVACAPGGVAGARIADLDALTARLAALSGPRHEAGPGALGLELERADVHVPLDAGLPRTVVLRGGVRCVEAPGSVFGHGQSCPGPDVAQLVDPLRALLDARPERVAALFGHADPTGREAYNKGLSERRAEAVRALLTHEPEVWERLWSGPEAWYLDAGVRRRLLTAAGHDAPPDCSQKHESEQLTRFQQEQGLAPTYSWTGAPTRPTRARLFQAYMSAMCPAPLDAARFTGPPGSTSPWMGCGERNPFVASSPEVRDEPSRRLVALVAPLEAFAGLPCRLGDLAPCDREELPAAERSEPTPHFRCRAWRTISAACGCRDGAPDEPFQVWFRAEHEVDARPLPNVRFALEALESGEVLARGTTDDAAEARVLVDEAGTFRVRLGHRAVRARLRVVDGDRDGAAIGGAGVQVTGSDGVVARGITGADGRVDLELAVGAARLALADGRACELAMGEDAAEHVVSAPVHVARAPYEQPHTELPDEDDGPEPEVTPFGGEEPDVG